MRLLSRYLLRQLWTPFLFAFSAMTSLMLLNQVARRFGDLVGKGLPWTVIGEVFLLCLPFIVAMTVPMGVLLAVLHGFSHLAADNEITAMRASGVSVGQMLKPVFLAATVVAVLNFWFIDQILPRSNARLRGLLLNIQRKKPTFELREQVINEIPQSQLFLRASRIDPTSGRLRSVTIYDLAPQAGRRIIYADSGRMAITSSLTDLDLKLFHGSIHEFKSDKPDLTQLTYFQTNTIRVKDVSNRLDLNATEDVRGDREMSTCEMLEIVEQANREIDVNRAQRALLTRRDLRALLGLAPPPPPGPVPLAKPSPYCRFLQGVKVWIAPTAAAAQTPAQRAPPGHPLEAEATPTQGRRAVALANWADVASARDNIRSATFRSDEYAVEVHKKWAISAACVVFVLVGIPMALRFPRGGMGLVIGGGLAVFALNYVGLIAGEGLGNRDVLSPAVAMWGPNAILTVVGLFGLWRVSLESGSTRGGDFADLIETLIGRFRRRAR